MVTIPLPHVQPEGRDLGSAQDPEAGRAAALIPGAATKSYRRIATAGVMINLRPNLMPSAQYLQLGRLKLIRTRRQPAPAPAAKSTMSQSNSGSLLLSLAVLCGVLSAVRTPAFGAEAADALGTAAIQAAALDRLEAKAELGGALPVIVRLRTETLPTIEPPSDLGGNTARAQRKFGERARLVARAQDRLAAAVGGHPARINRYRYLPLAVMRADRDTIRRLRALPDVLSVTEDRPHAPLLNTSVPHIGGNLAYNQGWTGAGQAVAVIDTGVQTSHPFFAGRVLHEAEACYSGAYQASLTTLCPNLPPDCPEVLAGSGGIPAHTACGTGAGVQCTGHGSCFHGTHVSGIVLSSDGTYRGVAPGANLIPIQVFVIEGGNLWAYDSDIIAGLEHVLRLSQAGTPIAAVNMSLGGDTYTSARDCNLDAAATKTAIDALRDAGIATVVAAGNDGVRTAIATPGCISSAVSVGATYDNDGIVYFSNLAPALTVFAPGYDVFSSVPTNAVGGASGTSMATPHVAGAFAVLRQKAAQTLLTPTIDNLVAALRLSGTPITDGANAYSTPRIQIDQALALLKSPLPVEVIMDSQTAAAGITTVSGSFTSVADTNAYGGSALRGAGTSHANTLRFTPTLTPGYYQVYAWWPVLSGNTSQTLVKMGGGVRTDQYFINQQQNGGRWNLVGPAYLGGSNYVEISDGGVPQVAADAVRFLTAKPPAITTTALTDAGLGVFYDMALGAAGGVPPYSWSLVSGALPPGLTLGLASGEIAGTPTQVGTFSFTVRVGDGYTQSAPQALTLNVGQSTNLATQSNGGVASTSSTQRAAFPATALNNGDRRGLNWGSGGGWNDATANSYPDWAQISLAGPASITEIDVFTLQDNYGAPAEPDQTLSFNNYGVTAFEAQYWDGATWVTVPGGTVTGNDKVWRQFNFPAVTTDRIRVLINGALLSYSRLVEIEAYGTPIAPAASPTNLAAQSNGGVASASSTQRADFPVTALNNGDRRGLNWGSGGGWNDGTGNSYPDWAQIILASPASITEIDVFTLQDNYGAPAEPDQTLTFNNYGVTAFEAQYWDGATWVTVPGGTVTGNNKVWRQFSFPAVTTDRIRVLINGALLSYSRLVEMEAWGKPIATGN